MDFTRRIQRAPPPTSVMAPRQKHTRMDETVSNFTKQMESIHSADSSRQNSPSPESSQQNSPSAESSRQNSPSPSPSQGSRRNTMAPERSMSALSDKFQSSSLSESPSDTEHQPVKREALGPWKEVTHETRSIRCLWDNCQLVHKNWMGLIKHQHVTNTHKVARDKLPPPEQRTNYGHPSYVQNARPYREAKVVNHQCEPCKKSFQYPKDLRRHIRNVKSCPNYKPIDNQIYKCNVAGCLLDNPSFGSRKDTLKRHMQTHHDQSIDDTVVNQPKQPPQKTAALRASRVPENAVPSASLWRAGGWRAATDGSLPVSHVLDRRRSNRLRGTQNADNK